MTAWDEAYPWLRSKELRERYPEVPPCQPSCEKLWELKKLVDEYLERQKELANGPQS